MSTVICADGDGSSPCHHARPQLAEKGDEWNRIRQIRRTGEISIPWEREILL